jgi:hypothetical protein
MPEQFTILAVLVTTIFPSFLAACVFFVALRWWVDRILQSDPGAHELLQLEVLEERVAWVIALDHGGFKRWPYSPLAWAALAALATTAIETVVFASSSAVPFLWYLSGTIVSVIALLGPFAAAGLLYNPLGRLTGRMLTQRANDEFAFATQAILEIRDIVRQIDKSYALMGLQARTNYLEDCRAVLLVHASLERDSALAEVVAVKLKCEYDLRCLQYLANLFENARAALEQARVALQGMETPQEAIEQIDNLLHSRDLTNALEDGRWSDARGLLEKSGSDLARILDRGAAMPETVEDAYRILNVSEETPTDRIKAVVNAYRQVWHPDLASDEIERSRCTLRMQQINVAWDVIQNARA